MEESELSEKKKKGEPEFSATKDSYSILRVKEEVSGIPTGNSFIAPSFLAPFALFALTFPAPSWLSEMVFGS